MPSKNSFLKAHLNDSSVTDSPINLEFTHYSYIRLWPNDYDKIQRFD